MHRGRAALAKDCVLAGLESQRGRPLNSIVTRHHQAGVPIETLADNSHAGCYWMHLTAN